jgi:predicted Zn-ribbon and HTH transcriptional regulator
LDFVWRLEPSPLIFIFVNLPAHIIEFRKNALARFGQAANRFARSGFATTPPEILATREAFCRSCPEWDAEALNKTGRCRKCGCSTWAKLRMATERCPLGKWEAVEPLTASLQQRAE